MRTKGSRNKKLKYSIPVGATIQKGQVIVHAVVQIEGECHYEGFCSCGRSVRPRCFNFHQGNDKYCSFCASAVAVKARKNLSTRQ